MTDLTTRQAAEFLSVSHSFLLELLRSRQLAGHVVGDEHCISAGDLARYKDRVDEQRRKALDELTAQAQELGLGY